ncbi:MAG: YopX family protein [Schwartzia sp.]|nr:YopX family protein [Schwartzia sp. (in: firmicutes)]
MRKILFRGKHLYSNGEVDEWRYGSLSVTTDGHAFINDHNCIVEVEPSTVGQYTGLPDCRGAMQIYEGDILKDTVHGGTAIVEWQDCGFVARLKHGKYGIEVPLNRVNEDWKVVGNIHDERPIEG